MNKVEKIIGLLGIIAILSAACVRGPHQESWRAGKPKKDHMEKKK